MTRTGAPEGAHATAGQSSHDDGSAVGLADDPPDEDLDGESIEWDEELHPVMPGESPPDDPFEEPPVDDDAKPEARAHAAVTGGMHVRDWLEMDDDAKEQEERDTRAARGWQPVNGVAPAERLLPPPQPASLIVVGDELPESWRRVDLGAALRGELTKIAPRILRREDGAALLYDGQLNWIHGADGVGKSWVALIACAQEISAGASVEWINLEDPDERVVAERLLELGADPAIIASRFHFNSPSDPFNDQVVEELVRRIVTDGITLVVIDSLGEALGLEGGNEDADVDVTAWVSRVARRLIAAGAAVLIIDHGTKAADNPLFASGSKRKRAAVTGAAYLVEAPQALTREHGGRIRLTCAKDRHGNYRKGDEVATIEFTRYPDDGMTVHVSTPAERERRPSPDQTLTIVARKAVQAAKEAGRPLSLTGLCELMNVKARAQLKRAAIELAVSDGALRTQDGPRRAVEHIYVRDLELQP